VTPGPNDADTQPPAAGPVVRPAASADIPTLIRFIHELAEFERSPGSVAIDDDQLRQALFSEHPTVFAHVATVADQVVGMAIWFLNFSTWTGRNGIYLEDLYVEPAARAAGVGRALLSELADIARRSGHGRVDWSVLKWNESAIRFYRSIGAEPMDEWVGYRLSETAIGSLAGPSDPTP
jgi:GNAT superfamily N-acetyltransferase